MNTIETGLNPANSLVSSLMDRTREEEGSLKFKIGAGVAAVGLTAVLAITHNISNPFSIEETLELEFGKGKITKVSLTVPEDCRWQFENKVQGASAKKTLELEVGGIGPGDLPGVGDAFKPNWKETFNGYLTNKPCNKKLTMIPEFNVKENKEGKEEVFVNIDVKPQFDKDGKEVPLFIDTVYRTNPLDGTEFTTDVDALGGYVDAAQSMIDGLNVANLEMIDPTFADSTHNGLQGLALLGAIKLSAEACGPLAWKMVRPLYAESLKEDWLAQYGAMLEAVGVKVVADNVTVNVPEEVTMAHQYTELFESTIESKENKGVEVNLPKVGEMECDADPKEVTIEDMTNDGS